MTAGGGGGPGGGGPGGGGGGAESCTPIGKCQGASLACSDSATCANGDVCCLTGIGGGTPKAACAKSCGGGGGGGFGGGGIQLCGSDAECPQGDTCRDAFGGLKICRGAIGGGGGGGGGGFPGGGGQKDGGH